MNGQQVIEYMTGRAQPLKPSSPDTAAWRAYLVQVQGVMLTSNESAKPSTVAPAAIARVKGEFLAAFPGRELLAAQIFTPADPDSVTGLLSQGVN